MSASPERPTIAPKTHALLREFNEYWGLIPSLCEAIDNSINARANRIDIDFGPAKDGYPKYARIKDNGVGCESRDRMMAMVTLGDHVAHGSELENARYGIGAKRFIMPLGGRESTVTIRSTRADTTRVLTVCWSNVLASNDWTIDPIEELSGEPGDKGTTITVAPMCRRLPAGSAWTKTLEDLSYTYTPALRGGLEIRVNRSARGEGHVSLAEYQLPEARPGPDCKVTKEIQLSDGRKARVSAWVVKDVAQNKRAGLMVYSQFRVVEKLCGAFARGYSIKFLSGTLELLDGWELTPDKRDIHGDVGELEAAVFDAIHPVLKVADTQASDLETNALMNEVNSAMADTILRLQETANTAKAKRKRTVKPGTGTVDPKNTGRRHKRAKNRQPGTSMPGGPKAAPGAHLKVEHLRLGTMDIGEFRGDRIILNEDNPGVAHSKATKNVLAICREAEWVLTIAFVCGGAKQLNLGFDPPEWADVERRSLAIAGEFIAKSIALDGEKVIEDAAGAA